MSGPLTIAHVSTRPDWYGGEEQAWLMLRGMAARGHRCVVWARRGGEFAGRLGEAGFEVETFRGNGRDPLSILRLRRGLRALRPDVAYFQDAHALTCGGLAALRLAIPARVAARRSQRRAQRFKYVQLCDLVIADSKLVAETLYEVGIPRDRVRVIYEGVDPERAGSGCRARGRKALRVADGELVLVVVASLVEAKGHADLLAALPRVFDAFPGARVALAGEGSLREPLAAEARQRGVAGRVDFLGYRRDVPDLLHAADLVVLPSRIEPLGSSLIDAMFAGAPIVATTAGGIPELVGADGDDPPVAFLAPPADPPALASTIIEALRNPDRRGDLVERARRRARARFTAEQMIEEHLRVYRGLL